MSINYFPIYILLILLTSCSSNNLHKLASLPNHLKEISAIETTKSSKILWMIEDSNNKNLLYGLDSQGKIQKEIRVAATNNDWEDLTSDNQGNVYIGDIGNNNGKRDQLYIYKIDSPENNSATATPSIIEFKLPKHYKKKDFEAFFLWGTNFYLFSKEHKNTSIFMIPNKIGKQRATFIGDLNLKGKKNPITAADINEDTDKIVLLSHKRFWILTNFNQGDFSDCFVQEFEFDQSSQKEGACFNTENTIYITDEKTKSDTGNIYEYKDF